MKIKCTPYTNPSRLIHNGDYTTVWYGDSCYVEFIARNDTGWGSPISGPIKIGQRR